MKQIAFWTYDLYPFTCWGEIDEKRVHSYDVRFKYVPSYQSFFKPFLILPDVDAQDVIQELKSLTNWKCEEEKQLKELFNNRLKKALPDHPKFKS